MQYEIRTEGRSTVLELRQHLAFKDRREFVDLIPALLTPEVEEIVLDMSELRFLDSAGLGLLLSLKEAAQEKGVSVSIRRPSAGVSTLLRLSSFETLFPIAWD